MKRIYYLISIVFLYFSCTDAEIGPISGSSGKPGQVEILDTVTVPGGVIVNYKIPAVNDILEIKAVYTLTSGEVRESSSSYYTSFLTIEGYNDTGEHEALIYTINRAREMSDPLPVKFRPGESPLSKAVKSMQIKEDFGGVNFSWKNPDNATLSFEFYTENEQGNMITMDITSSKSDSVDKSFRGYDTVPYKFAVNIRDNFGNSSGMIYPEGGYITPLYEIKFPKSDQKLLILAGDVSWTNWEGRDAHILDDDIMTLGHSFNNTVPGASFTIDLGKKAKLSRFILHQRLDQSQYVYAHGNPRIFEVYSSDEANGDWSVWTRRIVGTVVKPSGAAIGTMTEEDRVAANEGHEYSFPLDMPPVKYVRFRVLETWTNGHFTHIGEFTTYGFYVE